jgi:hypothetical protein
MSRAPDPPPAMNVDAERKAREIRFRAERRAGEILKDMDKAVGNQHTAKSASSHDGKKPTKGEQIAAIGISPKQAENWQKLASVPEETVQRQFAKFFWSAATMSPINSL